MNISVLACIVLCATAAAGHETFVKLIECGACVSRGVVGTADAAECRPAAKGVYASDKCAAQCEGLSDADGDNLSYLACSFGLRANATNAMHFHEESNPHELMKQCYLDCVKELPKGGSLAECKARRAEACGDAAACKVAGFLSNYGQLELGVYCDASDKDMDLCFVAIRYNMIWRFKYDVRMKVEKWRNCADYKTYLYNHCKGDSAAQFKGELEALTALYAATGCDKQ